MPLLKTRFHKPSLADSFILRQQLMDRLDHGQKKRLTLVVGGAGYGKSILVSQWLNERQHTYCWISLEEDCNDLQVFLSYLVVGVQQTYPDSMPRTAQLMLSSILPTVLVVAETLINDLSDIKGRLSIVVDDLHKINNQKIFELLNQLIQLGPEHSRLVLISRVDPPLKKAKFRAYNQLCEIRMSDLRLTETEIIQLAKNSDYTSITSETARIIEEKTEGWILGVNLISNLNFNWYAIDPSEFRDGDSMKSGESAHVNLIWSPYKKVNVGIEYMILKRINTNDTNGTGQRLQMMIKYII
jgi:LuxR family maltose regulon positive regulatory protein